MEEAQASGIDLGVVNLQEAFKTFYTRQDRISKGTSMVGEEGWCSGRGRVCFMKKGVNSSTHCCPLAKKE